MISERTRRNMRKEFRQSFLAKLGIILVGTVVLAAVFAPFVAPHDPTNQRPQEGHAPPFGVEAADEELRLVDGERERVKVEVEGTLAYPLGTDALGRGLLSRAIYGARTSLLVGILGTLIAAVLGVSVGIVAGYYGGRVDDTLMRGADIMLAFPALVLAIALIGLFGTTAVRVPDPFVAAGLAPGMPETFVIPGTVTVVVALVNWVWFARVARAEALTLADESFVKAARNLGASDRTIIIHHVLPNSFTPILVLATIQVASIILLESGLSFIGFSGTNLSWGFDIAQGRQYLANSWWIATVPGLAIMLTVVGINLLGDWMRDVLDPGIEGEQGGM